jgi:hypothetical protein
MSRAVALGLGLGAAWGVGARIWMRLITTQPEFSWSGTLVIIGFSALLGLGVGVVHAARRTGRSIWWTLAVVPGLILFMSPGMLLAPSFLLGGLAWGARGRALRAVGVVAVLGSLVAGWLLGRETSPGAELSAGDVAVFVTGYVALALALAWAGSLVWQRRVRPGTGDEAVRTPTVVPASSGS